MAQYEAVPTERKWQQLWKEMGIYHFDFNSDKPVYSIDNPPRYTSGALHLGHATGYSLIDFAARYHRMRGFNVMFPLCFDVNGTPVEVKVEKKHKITKLNTSRQEYIRLCEEFANSFIAEMTRQFEILGESMDPSVYYQTNAPYYRRITQISFLQMLKKGLAYKGTYPVNWCPSCITALADAEVEYDKNVTKLNYITFGLKGTKDTILIATTRPELLCTCQLIAVHPTDEKYKGLVGKTAIVPIFNKEVKIIADDKVDPAFGTGIVMICTIGDKTDLEWVMKYHLPLEKGIDEQGRMTELAGKYKGMAIKEARKQAIEDLKEMGLLIKQEDQPQNVGICWRCHAPIEFLQVEQWFIKTMPFKQEILALADEINWFPEFMKVRLQDWVNSLQWDWVVSRQRYFATPIPVWECAQCKEVVPAREEDCYIDPTITAPPVPACPKCGGTLVACPDVFDTWMDSSISPLYCTFWQRDEERFKKLYPMTMRPQSHDIIRTWAFYTMLREHLVTGQKPWENIMIHGFIMAPDGTPMHTSAGNVIDPMPILDEFGADALRYYACTCALGEDNAFREKDVVHGKKLCTKIWNLGKLVEMSMLGKPPEHRLHVVDEWILSRYSKTVEAVTDHMEAYQFDKAMREVEEFAWKEFADHYVEMVKHRTRDVNDEGVRYTLYTVYMGIIKMMAPMLPHVTEDAYQAFSLFDGHKSIHVSEWPKPVLFNETAEEKGELVKDIIAALRSWKSERKMALNAEIAEVELIGAKAETIKGCERDIAETVKAKSLLIEEKADLEEKVVAVVPNKAKIGPMFRANGKEVMDAIKNADPEELAKQMAAGTATVTLTGGMVVPITTEIAELQRSMSLHGKMVQTLQVGDVLIAITP
ncbi:MAG: Isoleucine--tRNA ligase [Methanomassiliicoccales archaeon PtaU1.Bin124]|nr:MAG: Isoleucine--tRNA ligase [Methanomassiliicoccales archaeon PtaU1.Bin124]